MKPYLTAYKYNIYVQEVPNTGRTWLIYEDFLNKGIENPKYIDHIEISKECNYHTSERTYGGLGFCFVIEGRVTFKLNEITGARYALILPNEVL